MARGQQPDKHRHVATSNAPHDATANARRTDQKLDAALKATFPASDPFALTVDEDPNSHATYASPPCFMHELDPSYLGLAPDPPRRNADYDEATT
ncbi:MAG: hypothetical protein ACREGK_10210, partial [Geminicoccales bacterium]